MRLSNLPLPEPHVALLAAGLVLQRRRPWRLPGDQWVHRLVGWPLIAAGGVMITWSTRAAGQVHLAAPDSLVTTGPFAVSRNPMYAAWTLLALGAGVARGSAWIMAGLPVVAWATHRAVLREEGTLADRFGEAADRYLATVPRYVPRTTRAWSRRPPLKARA